MRRFLIRIPHSLLGWSTEEDEMSWTRSTLEKEREREEKTFREDTT
jgi:hypothetical protein